MHFATDRMETLYQQQEEIALRTAVLQMHAEARSEAMQMTRDFVKDVKEYAEAVGEAGHKPG